MVKNKTVLRHVDPGNNVSDTKASSNDSDNRLQEEARSRMAWDFRSLAAEARSSHYTQMSKESQNMVLNRLLEEVENIKSEIQICSHKLDNINGFIVDIRTTTGS